MPKTLAAADRAYLHVKQSILSGAFAGGELVSEGVVAAELGMSRTPVHEAFLRLDTEKLVTLHARKGAAVTPMPPHEARDVVEMREAIEASAVRRALGGPGPSPAALAELRLLVDRQSRLAADSDIEAFAECDAEFHGALIRASGNAIASQMYNLLRDRQLRLRLQLLHIRPEHLSPGAQEHVALLDAFEAGDAETYCALLHTHLSYYLGTR